MGSRLSARVVAQIERLGGRVTEAPADAPTELEGRPLPEALRDLAYGVRWPERASYASDEGSELRVWGLRWRGLAWLSPVEVPVADRGERPLVIVAEADGGNHLLCASLDDSHLSDPEITLVARRDPEQEYDRCSGASLSEVLASLRLEAPTARR
jgi:hypothetical protein